MIVSAFPTCASYLDMSKRKSPKKLKSKRRPPVQPPPRDQDAKFILLLNFCSFVASVIAVCLWVIPTILFLATVRTAPIWIYITFLLLVVSVKVRSDIYERAIALISRRTSDSFRAARKPIVLALAISIFQMAVGCISAVYGLGYQRSVSGFIERLFSLKASIGEKTFLAMSFAIGALVSGILGNIAYDLLKISVKRVVSGKD